MNRGSLETSENVGRVWGIIELEGCAPPKGDMGDIGGLTGHECLSGGEPGAIFLDIIPCG